jgi:6,7-dimethyl-8-ribityllumazine synthase
VICLGCIIRGETPHFTYICQGVTQGITQLNLDYNIPFIFGILTTDIHEQAIARAGGEYGNKGDESAITAIKMAALQQEMEK